MRAARAVEQLRPQIGTSAAVDLIACYAEPLPVRVISELLGIPVMYRSQFLAVLKPLLNQSSGEQKQAAADELTIMLTALTASSSPAPDPSKTATSALIHGPVTLPVRCQPA